MKKAKCKLTGTDGNVFAIIGRVCEALRKSGQEDQAQQFRKLAMSAKSYDEVLTMAFEYVEIL